MINKHAELNMKIGEFAGDKAAVLLRIEGCKNCMIKALAETMAADPSFRALINSAGLLANKIRRGEAPAKSINPQHN
jgi:hypothetical protein